MKKTDSYLYLEIAESLRGQIASGELRPGEKLPPVREMAKRLGCTPSTVSRGYAQLAQEGLVEGRRGGGTVIAPSGLGPERPLWRWASLINRAEQYLLEALSGGHAPAQAEAALAIAVARWRELQQQRFAQLAPEPSVRTPTSQRTRDDIGDEETGAGRALRFAGSHDLTIELLARMLAMGGTPTQLSVVYVGSLGGLIALARDEADVAGIHLWDQVSDSYNVPFVQRLLPGQRVALLTVAQRSLGLITAPGNPCALCDLADLARPDVRLVNRQSGSGTRVWLDAQLKALRIPPQTVTGYEREELTHTAVARAVEAGEASVGLGIHAAAAAYGLGFVPLTQERYDLAFPEAVWGSPAAQALVEIIRTANFAEAVSAMGGYDTAETGKETWVS